MYNITIQSPGRPPQELEVVTGSRVLQVIREQNLPTDNVKQNGRACTEDTEVQNGANIMVLPTKHTTGNG